MQLTYMRLPIRYYVNLRPFNSGPVNNKYFIAFRVIPILLFFTVLNQANRAPAPQTPVTTHSFILLIFLLGMLGITHLRVRKYDHIATQFFRLLRNWFDDSTILESLHFYVPDGYLRPISEYNVLCQNLPDSLANGDVGGEGKHAVEQNQFGCCHIYHF